MSLHYIVDGYNVIRSTDALAVGPLRDQRERLLKFIEDKKPQGSSANRVTVVFDGRADVTGPRWGGAVEVVFSRGPDADQIIKNRVDDAARPADVVVVTDDRAVQRWTRGRGARLLSCAAFLAAGRGRASARRRPALTVEEAEDINEELKRLWKLK